MIYLYLIAGRALSWSGLTRCDCCEWMILVNITIYSIYILTVSLRMSYSFQFVGMSDSLHLFSGLDLARGLPGLVCSANVGHTLQSDTSTLELNCIHISFVFSNWSAAAFKRPHDGVSEFFSLYKRELHGKHNVFEYTMPYVSSDFNSIKLVQFRLRDNSFAKPDWVFILRYFCSRATNSTQWV